MIEEIWKDIIGYEGLYQASNLGRIKALAKEKRGKFNNITILKEHIKKQTFGSNGYAHTNLRNKNGELKTKDVHTIIAETFLLKDDENKEVNHINGNRKDNRLENLEYVTRSDNLKHRYRVLKSTIVGAKKVLCVENGCVYKTMKEVCIKYKTSYKILNKSITENKPISGMHFVFV